ncbi:MAG: hypothetical protein PHW56_11865, partial [Methanosarcinaceae archaeon]|nr:hypothetical protein [Methanosarcinaceae archaeon]
EGPYYSYPQQSIPTSFKQKVQLKIPGQATQKVLFQNRPDICFRFFKLAGLSTPRDGFYTYSSPFRPGLIFCKSTPISGNCLLISSGGNGVLPGRAGERPFRDETKKFQTRPL